MIFAIEIPIPQLARQDDGCSGQYASTAQGDEVTGVTK